jgi:hypothetical protein
LKRQMDSFAFWEMNTDDSSKNQMTCKDFLLVSYAEHQFSHSSVFLSGGFQFHTLLDGFYNSVEIFCYNKQQ